MTSNDQKIEDLQRELALTRVDFSTRLQKLEQKISALTDGYNVDKKTPFEQPEHNPAQAPSPAKPLQVTGLQNQLAAFDEPAISCNTDSVTKPFYIVYLLKETTNLALSLLSPITKFVSPLLNLYKGQHLYLC